MTLDTDQANGPSPTQAKAGPEVVAAAAGGEVEAGNPFPDSLEVDNEDMLVIEKQEKAALAAASRNPEAGESENGDPEEDASEKADPERPHGQLRDPELLEAENAKSWKPPSSPDKEANELSVEPALREGKEVFTQVETVEVSRIVRKPILVAGELTFDDDDDENEIGEIGEKDGTHGDRDNEVPRHGNDDVADNAGGRAKNQVGDNGRNETDSSNLDKSYKKLRRQPRTFVDKALATSTQKPRPSTAFAAEKEPEMTDDYTSSDDEVGRYIKRKRMEKKAKEAAVNSKPQTNLFDLEEDDENEDMSDAGEGDGHKGISDQEEVDNMLAGQIAILEVGINKVISFHFTLLFLFFRTTATKSKTTGAQHSVGCTPCCRGQSRKSAIPQRTRLPSQCYSSSCANM